MPGMALLLSFEAFCAPILPGGIPTLSVYRNSRRKAGCGVVLLGISRDGVQRLERTSKSVLQKWPLTIINDFCFNSYFFLPGEWSP